MKTKLLKNKDMSESVYELRRKVIALIYEAKKLADLPRIEVRITNDHDSILGAARIGEKIIWITESFVASRSTVFHEILHAVFNQRHIAGCPLMAPQIDPNLKDDLCNKLFKKYAKVGNE